MANTTHYENLKVARDAPSDVIRAAYKELIQQYASDQNPSADASRQMKIIHNSYSILSNPIQKGKYDQWLVEQQAESGDARKPINNGQQQGGVKRFNSRASQPVEAITSVQPDNKIGEILELTLVAGNEIANIPKTHGVKRTAWPVYGAIGLLVLSAAVWFGFLRDAPDNTNQQQPIANDAAATGQTAASINALPAPATGNGPILMSARIPAHDPVEIDKFIGLWKGIDDVSAVQQSLDISLKSNHSFAFRLDTKAGQNIGGLYGIAEFEAGYARFHNKEYGCDIVFTIKSQVLQVGATGCQAFYRSGAIFSGGYMRPNRIKPDSKPAPTASKPAAAKATAVENAASKPQSEAPPPAAAKPVPKLRKYAATVKDPDGGTTTIELIAKDKEAARAIIRDFRGNPKVIKIKELK